MTRAQDYPARCVVILDIIIWWRRMAVEQGDRGNAAQDYRFTNLPPHLLKELQTFEARLSTELGKEVILICYDGSQ